MNYESFILLCLIFSTKVYLNNNNYYQKRSLNLKQDIDFLKMQYGFNNNLRDNYIKTLDDKAFLCNQFYKVLKNDNYLKKYLDLLYIDDLDELFSFLTKDLGLKMPSEGINGKDKVINFISNEFKNEKNKNQFDMKIFINKNKDEYYKKFKVNNYERLLYLIFKNKINYDKDYYIRYLKMAKNKIKRKI